MRANRRSNSGFAVPPLAYLLAGIALVAALAGLYAKVYHDGYASGAAKTQQQWDASVLAAEKKAAEDAKARDAIIADLRHQLEAARGSASDYQLKWQEALDAAHKKGTQLVACVRRTRSATSAAKAAIADAAKSKSEAAAVESGASDYVALLSYRYLGLWDSAWTGTGGQPLFGDPQQLAERYGASAGPDGISSYDTDDLLKNHGANAQRQSACLRDIESVRTTVQKLSDDWEARHKQAP